MAKDQVFGFRGSSAQGISFERITVGSSNGPSKAMGAFSTSTVIFEQIIGKTGYFLTEKKELSS
jgi:hypothetical protein